jgi:hypothetical protein
VQARWFRDAGTSETPFRKGEQGGVKGRQSLTQQREPQIGIRLGHGDDAQRDLVGYAKGHLRDAGSGRGHVAGPALVQHRVDVARMADRAAGEGDGNGALVGVVGADRGGQVSHAGSFWLERPASRCWPDR